MPNWYVFNNLTDHTISYVDTQHNNNKHFFLNLASSSAAFAASSTAPRPRSPPGTLTTDSNRCAAAYLERQETMGGLLRRHASSGAPTERTPSSTL